MRNGKNAFISVADKETLGIADPACSNHDNMRSTPRRNEEPVLMNAVERYMPLIPETGIFPQK